MEREKTRVKAKIEKNKRNLQKGIDKVGLMWYNSKAVGERETSAKAIAKISKKTSRNFQKPLDKLETM